MSVIAFASSKGGSGKTTAALYTWAALNQEHQQVLGIDLDVQGNFTSAAATDNEVEPENTIFEVLTGECIIPDAILHAPMGDYIASSPNLINLNVPGDNLKKSLKIVQKQYKHIILDTPPAITGITINALTAANIVIIPVQADMFSLSGVKQLAEIINFVRQEQNPTLRIGGLLVSRFTARANIRKELREIAGQMATSLNTKLFNTAIRDSAVIVEAQLLHQSLFDVAPKAKVTEDFRCFITELEEIIS